MIPKKIHYCWFGRGEKPALALACIESWKKFCPDYELIEWNEDNFDISSNRYVQEAYSSHKFAFVTDYVRLWAMYNYGGIYMDTDVEVLKPLDEYLFHEAFSGFENATQIPTGLMASQKNFPLFKDLLSYYDTVKFINDDGTLNLTTNVKIITNMLLERGFKPNGKYQIVNGFTIYPQNVFCPDHSRLTDKKYMKETATIHFFAGSWKSEAVRKRENSWWWKYIVFPLSVLSRKFETYGGRPYKWLLNNTWRKTIKKMNNR